MMTQCPTNYGRRNRLRQVSDMIEHLRTHALLVQKRDRLIREGKPIPEGMFVVGELVRRHRPAMGVRA
ncbi:2-oxoglutarate oxidoreductase, beta subunit [hydrocarbon metagenome]|uniref:2-oxoglutarate oxidoreductase, beta subunit n=1 Tax=hydrocarbon metagenome TaxID=938273 RepID=A0A0W8FHE0_9ZZZZ